MSKSALKKQKKEAEKAQRKAEVAARLVSANKVYKEKLCLIISATLHGNYNLTMSSIEIPM